MADCKPWFVYIIECQGGRLYTGISTDVSRRYQMHVRGKGARFTRLHPPLALRLVLQCASRSEALKTEYAIKQLSPDEKRRLCAQALDSVHDASLAS